LVQWLLRYLYFIVCVVYVHVNVRF
jgi:hypothetical protein